MEKELIRSIPENEGIESELIINFLNEAEKEDVEIHGIMVLVHNKIIFEAYNAPYKKEIPHVMHSFTKCLTNTAAGIAYTQGLIRMEDKVLDFFPQYKEGANENLKSLTVRNLITMRSGQERGIGGNEWRPLKTSWLDAYFKVPFTEKPGSRFLYSSGNSYILSAIVQKVTGKTCHQLIEEHLSDKIGLRSFTWMESPEGICSGGNGTSLTVEDIARMGVLYLNDGKWNGEQVLSKEWVDLSLGRMNPQERSEDEKEYNFHWEHQKDIWYASGMFGQICAIIPELDMVIAITAADKTHSGAIKIMQETVVEPAKAGYKSEKNMWNVLKTKGLRMSLEDKDVSVEKHYIPEKGLHVFKADGTIDGITEISLEFQDDGVVYGVKDAKGEHQVKAGMEYWKHGSTTMTGGYLHHQYEMDKARIAASAYWSEQNVLMMKWRYPGMAFYDHVAIAWEKGKIRMKRWVNMNSQDLERPEVTAYAI